MRITVSTTPQSVADKTKSSMKIGAIPNMHLKEVGSPNGFVSNKKDYQFWINQTLQRT